MSDRKGAEIRRMACHKVAIEAVGPIPAKGISDAWKARFIEVTDFLDADVISAGLRDAGLDPGTEPATIVPESTDEGDVPRTLTLDEAILADEWIKKECGSNLQLKKAVGLKITSFGVKNPKDLLAALAKITPQQLDELKNYITTEG